MGSISDGWLLAALKAQQAPSPCCSTPGGLPGGTGDALTWPRVAGWANTPQRALAETQHPPSHHQTPTGHSLMPASRFQGYLGTCRALSTKTPWADISVQFSCSVVSSPL